MSAARRTIWSVVVTAAVGTVAVAAMVIARGGGGARPTVSSETPAIGGPGSAARAVNANAPGSVAVSQAMERVSQLAARQDPSALSELIDLYGKLANQSGALEVRQAAIHALLAQPDMRVGLAAALTAIAADPTPKLQDPMWPYLVHGVAGLWNGATIEHGRDLVVLEARPKPKDVLLESLAEVPPGKLSDAQRANLAADLIDVYPRLRPDQRPAVDRALVALGSSDLVEILGRRGLAEDNYLKAAIEEKRAQEAARTALGVGR